MSAPARFAAWLRRVIDAVESQPWGPAVLVPVVAAVIAIRNLAEIAIGGNPVFEGIAAFVHYPLAYVAPFVALSLVLALWGGVAPLRVARLMMLAWLLTLVPPLADLALHREHAPTIGYLDADPVDLPRIWLRFLDPRVGLAGTTAGIRLETLLAVLLGGLYAGLVSRRAWRGAGAALTVYMTALFFFSLPVLVTALFRLLQPALLLPELFHGVGTLFRASSAPAAESVGILWLVPLLLLLGRVWVAAERRFAPAAAPGGVGEQADDQRPPAGGPAVLLAGAALAGAYTAVQLHFPANRPPPFAPYDALALAGTVLAAVLLAQVALRPAPGFRSAWHAVAAGLLLLALGRSASVGLVAAAAFLVPFGVRIVPRRFVAPALAAALGGAGVAGFAGGYGLVIGPEGLARMPAGSAGIALGAGLALGLWDGLAARRPWHALPVCAAGLALGTILAGHPRALVVALPVGLVAGLVAAGTAAARRARSSLATGAALAFSLAILLNGLLATDFVREAWARAATCVPDLDVVRGERFESEQKWDLAEGAYRKAIGCDERHAPAWRRLGLLTMQREPDRTARITDFLERAVRFAPESPTDLANLAGWYLREDRAGEALPLLERARALDPGHRQTAFNRAQALEDLGRLTEAAAAWREYLALVDGRPGLDEDAREARAHLRRLAAGAPTVPAAPRDEATR